MAKVVRFYEPGGPEVLRYEDAEVGEPGPGQERLRHVAVGLNYADTYFRNGTYPIPMPNGIGVEAAGVVQAVGEGVGVNVVFDSVGRSTFMASLDSLKRCGLMVCVGTASGTIEPFDPQPLAIKGSRHLTRPALR